MASRCSQACITRGEIEVDRNCPCSARRKRTKKSAGAVRHLCPNLGGDGAIRFAALRAFPALPKEITFSSTLHGIHRYIWRADWFPIGPKGSLDKALAITIVSSPTCTGCKWVLWLRGLANCKYDQPYRVGGEYCGDSTWDSDDFRLSILASDANLSSRTFTARKHPSNITDPEPDRSWVLQELAHAKDAATPTRQLTSSHVDKRDFRCQARRTTDFASARLRFGKSIPIDDILILLGGRRRLEIPLLLSRACARNAYRLCAGGEGIIRDSISWCGQNGASHRDNCDTPPLGGNCRETCECSRGNILLSDR